MKEPVHDPRIITSPWVVREGQSSLRHYVTEFLLVCQARNLAAGSLMFYRQKLYPFVEWLECQGVSYPEDVKASHLRRYLVHLQDSNHTPGGQHAYYRAVRAFFNWLRPAREAQDE